MTLSCYFQNIVKWTGGKTEVRIGETAEGREERKGRREGRKKNHQLAQFVLMYYQILRTSTKDISQTVTRI